MFIWWFQIQSICPVSSVHHVPPMKSRWRELFLNTQAATQITLCQNTVWVLVLV